jgi:LysR family nitrogen assimilation transcriptional regulator
MDLRQLRYFVAVAERGGFGAAASALNVAQSALSRHVKLLEHELGGALFERGARGVAVTEAGKVLLARGRWLLDAIDDIKAEVLSENRNPGGTVRLGAPSSLADNFYAPLARLFARRFPRVRLELSDGLTEEMTDRLLRGELDLAIVTAPQPNDHLDYETLVTEQVFLIGPPRDPLLGRGSLTRKEFNRLPAAVLPLSRSILSSIPSSLKVENMTPLKQMVASGLGYGLLPFSGIHQEVAHGTLSAARLPWLSANRVLALPRGRPTSRATRETVTALKEICRDLIEDGKILTVRTRPP